MKSFWRLVYGCVSIGLLASSVWAADQADQANQPNQADPPGRVARVDYATGEVSVQPHGTDEWVQADLNRPLTLSDNVWADKDSRAELDLGTGRLRISAETSITLTNVTNEDVQISLHQGALNVHVTQLYSGEVWEVDTPNLAFTVSRTGDYRFDVDPNADTTVVTVWKGEGEATGQGNGVQIKEGEQAQFSSGNSLTHQTRAAANPDGFDDWCRLRDQSENRSASAKHVAPGVVGTDDLDTYGTWRETPDYGWVWAPTAVAPGWAPYTAGQWAWVAPWGWTWVDASPWGFAPFHYGRWVAGGGGWAWAPGPYAVRPWYAPALVAWFGGPQFGVSFGFGVGFGWCPLGWGEPFYPWYHASPYYFQHVNIANTRIVNITHVSNEFFHNGGSPLYGHAGYGMPRFASRPGAMTAMSRTALEHGLPVRGNSVRVSPNQIQGASALGRIDANPTHASMVGARTGQTAARPSAATLSRPTVSRMGSPATRPMGSQAGMAPGNSSPRPNVGQPARGSDAPRGIGSEGNRTASAPGSHYVPRPPQSFGTRNQSSTVAMNHTDPRPGAGAASSNRMGTPSRSQVPRPSGAVGPSRYSGYQASYGRSTRDYGSNYSNRAYSNYGGYGRPGTSTPRYSAPPYATYGGHSSYSAPSHSSGGHSGSSGGSGSHGGGGGGGGGGHSSGGAHSGHR